MGNDQGLIRSLRRASWHARRRLEIRCPVCRQRRPRLALAPGDAPAGSRAADQALSGVCSDECAATYYRLRDERGNPVCVCGEIVKAPMSECPGCRVSKHTKETGDMVHSERLA